MLETFDETRILSAIHELTTKMSKMGKEIQALEGGGGSSNYKEVYTGTISTFTDDLTNIAERKFATTEEWENALINQDITMSLELNMSSFGASEHFSPAYFAPPTNDYQPKFQFVFIDTEEETIEGFEMDMVIHVNDSWASYVGMSAYLNNTFMNSTTLHTLMANVPYTLTLYFHKMPQA